MTKFSFALVVMCASAGSISACQSAGKGFQDRIEMIAPCPIGENFGGSMQTPTLSQAGYAAQFPGAGYIPTAAEAFAYYIAQQQAENARIAAENARIKAAILKAHADAVALQVAIASLDAEIAGLNEAPAAKSASSSRSGSRPASRTGCMSPIFRSE